MSWTVDGTTERANIVTHSNSCNSCTVLFLEGYAGDTTASYHQVSIWLPKPLAVGTYSIGAGAVGSYSTVVNRTGFMYQGRTGSITVTSLTTANIKGTFAFAQAPTTPQSVVNTIPNGTFDVDF